MTKNGVILTGGGARAVLRFFNVKSDAFYKGAKKMDTGS